MEHAILRLQRWVRRRHLRHQSPVAGDQIDDLREWKRAHCHSSKLDESEETAGAGCYRAAARRIRRCPVAPAQDATPVVFTSASSVITAADLQAVMDEAERLAQELGMADVLGACIHK